VGNGRFEERVSWNSQRLVHSRKTFCENAYAMMRFVCGEEEAS